MSCAFHETPENTAHRVCGSCGQPLPLLQVWPPRLIAHQIENHPVGDWLDLVFQVSSDLPGLWFVSVRADGTARDDKDQEVAGLEFTQIDRARQGGTLALKVRFTQAHRDSLGTNGWLRQPLRVTLEHGGEQVSFQWFLYLTTGEPTVTPARQAALTWVDRDGAQIFGKELALVAHTWVEINPQGALFPACWLHDPLAFIDGRTAARRPARERLRLIVPSEGEVVPPSYLGWIDFDGSARMGASIGKQSGWISLAVHHHAGGVRPTYLAAVGTSGQATIQTAARISVRSLRPVMWPEIDIAPSRVRDVYALSGSATRTKLTFAFVNLSRQTSDPARFGERVLVTSLALSLPKVGSLGTWSGEPVGIEQVAVPFTVFVSTGMVGEAESMLTAHFIGRPTRGVVLGDVTLRAVKGPTLRRRSVQTENGKLVSPWLILDLGTTGSCAAAAFRSGSSTVVSTVDFGTPDEGAILPSRVYLAPDAVGHYGPVETGDESPLYTDLVKLGLRYGEDAHPGCPDNVAASHVAQSFLTRFLSEVRQRLAWFPLGDASVLLSFPPRLMNLPTFARTFKAVAERCLQSEIWGGQAHPERVFFREEAFLVAMPALFAQLTGDAGQRKRSHLYWVIDFGGGTTDVCGFRYAPDRSFRGLISDFTYPQKVVHHLAGEDITAAFYAELRDRFTGAGLVNDGSGKPNSFTLPVHAQPNHRSAVTSLHNQKAMRALAEALKRLDMRDASDADTTVLEVARSLHGDFSLIDVDQKPRPTEVVFNANDAVKAVGALPAKEVHTAVLEAGGVAARIDELLEESTAALEARLDALKASGSLVDIADVHVLLGGRASLFWPIVDKLDELLARKIPGYEPERNRVHMTHDWVHSVSRDNDRFDRDADLKSLTVFGGGLFAVDQSHHDFAHLVLGFGGRRLEVPVYLHATGLRPVTLVERLELEAGSSAAIQGVAEGLPLIGEVELLIEALPEDLELRDRSWETIAAGECRRVGNDVTVTGSAMTLRTEPREFVLDGLGGPQPSVRLALEYPEGIHLLDATVGSQTGGGKP